MSHAPLPAPSRLQPLRDFLSSRLGRGLMLWPVILLGLWFFADRSAVPPTPRGSAVSDRDWGALSYLPLLLAGGLLAWLAAVRIFSRANQRGLDLLMSGDTSAAAEQFRRLTRYPLVLGRIARYNLGLACFRLGDLGGAAEAFALTHRRGPKALRSPAASMLALSGALRGDLDTTTHWIAEARRLTSSGTASVSRLHLAAEAVVALRQGQPGTARMVLERAWMDIERSTTADLVRGLRLVRAFAAETEGGEAAALAPDLLAGARPFRPGEYVWLGGCWPEMAAYLAAKGFT